MPTLGTDPSGTTSPSLADPGQVPGSSTGGPGGPGAIDPNTGLPIVPTPGGSTGGGTGKPGTPGAPKEVTIKDGNRTITVGQPDARSRSKVTVDDGEGEPNEYEVDFTPNEPGEETEEGVIQADENGKVVLQDGDAAITLEQVPGQSGQLKMTVDDGTPTTYDMDFEAGQEPELPGTSTPEVPDVSTPASLGGGADTGGGAGGGGAGAGGGGGGSFGGGETPGTSGGGGAQGTSPQPGVSAGAMPDSDGDQRPAAAAAAGGAGGPGDGGPGGKQGGMMGGMPMGGMGGGGGQGGDQTRQSKWRTTGQLFDDNDPAANFSGVVGHDPGEKPKAPKR